MTRDEKERLYLALLPQMRMEACQAARRFGGNREDLIQEACLAAWVAIDGFDESRGVKLWTFISSCIRYRLLTAWQTAKRHARTPSIGLALDEQDPFAGYDEPFSFEELTRTCRPRDAEILRLWLVDGLTQEAIGKQQGCSYQAIGAICRRGLNAIRERRELRKQ